MQKILGLNYLSEIVFQSNEGRSSLKNTNPNDLAQILLLDPNESKNPWLCACAFIANLENPIYQNDAITFFKIITEKIPKNDLKKISELFAWNCAHAFVLFYANKMHKSKDDLIFVQNLFFQKKINILLRALGADGLFFYPFINAQIREYFYNNAKNLSNIYINNKFNPLIDLSCNNTFYSSFEPADCYPLKSKLLPYSIKVSQQIPEHSFSLNLIFNWENSCLEEQFVSIYPEFKNIDDLSFTQKQQKQSFSFYKSVDDSTISDQSTTANATIKAQQELFAELRKKIPNWKSFILNTCNIPSEEKLFKALSIEQMDALGLALNSFSNGKNFILADETGLGKGRILAALCRTFLSNGRKVFFITEKRTLFTDFWRDLTAVYQHFDDSAPPEPFLLHSKAKIYDQKANLIFKAHSAKQFEQIIADKSSPSKLVFSTYSQFNKNLKKHPKLSFAIDHATDALLILDESHCAAGDSQTNINIQTLIKKSVSTIFSSATFSKTEEGLKLYLSALPLSADEFSLLLNILPPDSDQSLTSTISQALIRSGCMIRREHPPHFSTNAQPAFLDVAQQDKAAQSQEIFSSILETTFEIAQIFDQSPFSQNNNQKTSIWLRLGALLARASRQHLLLTKLDATICLVEQLLQNNKKPVIALQSTFETFLQSSFNKTFLNSDEFISDLEFSHDEDEVSKKVLSLNPEECSFPAMLLNAIDAICPLITASSISHPSIPILLDKLKDLFTLLPKWTSSPIDYIIEQLHKKNITVAEISGRCLSLHKIDEHFEIKSLALPQREESIFKFNNGDVDVLILTQAGATGISIHSDSLFKDQRQRAFVELEIATNAALRLQFLGRTRRKGQLSAPLHYVVLSKNPFEQRLLERAFLKEEKIQNIQSSTEGNLKNIPLELFLFSPYVNECLILWLASESLICKKLHLNPFELLKTVPHLVDGPIDVFLRRFGLLSKEQQSKALDFLQSIVPQLESSYELSNNTLVERQIAWGPSNLTTFSPNPLLPAVFIDTCIAPGNAQNITSKTLKDKIKNDFSISNKIKETINLYSTKYTHPIIRTQINNLIAALPFLKIGNKCTFEDQFTFKQKQAIILDITPPSNDEHLCFPTHWKISLLFSASCCVQTTSLFSLFQQKAIHITNYQLKENSFYWDQAGFCSTTTFSLSGHCVYTRWWKNKLFPPQNHNLSSNLYIPCRASFDALPIPLLHPNLVVELLLKEPNCSILNSITENTSNVILKKHYQNITLIVDKQAHDLYIDFPLDRKLGPRKYLSNGFVERYIPAKMLHHTLFSLYKNGICFFAPATKKNWHALALQFLLKHK